MKLLLSCLVLLLIAIYEKIISPKICIKKINRHIHSLNGEVLNIKKLSFRDETYLVDYKINENISRLNVKFRMVHKEEWF